MKRGCKTPLFHLNNIYKSSKVYVMQLVEDKKTPTLLATNVNSEDVATLKKWISIFNKDLHELGYIYKFELSIDCNDVYLKSL